MSTQQQSFDTGEGTRQRPPLPVLSMSLLSASVALLLASHAPAPLVMAVLANLLLLSAMAAGAAALVLLQRPGAPELNLWDKALLLAFASTAASLFVDVEGVRAFLEASKAGAAATAS